MKFKSKKTSSILILVTQIIMANCVYHTWLDDGSELGSDEESEMCSLLGSVDGSLLGSDDDCELGSDDGSKMGSLLDSIDEGSELGSLIGSDGGSLFGSDDGSELGSLLGLEDGSELGSPLGSDDGYLLCANKHSLSCQTVSFSSLFYLGLGTGSDAKTTVLGCQKLG